MILVMFQVQQVAMLRDLLCMVLCLVLVLLMADLLILEVLKVMALLMVL